MLKLYTFPRNTYTLLVLEEKEFEESDLISLEQQYRAIQVDGSKGVAIACAPETNLVAVGDLFSYFRNRSVWQGAYVPKLRSGSILVGNAFAGTDMVRGKSFKVQIPCLECYREIGEELLLKQGAHYPYCTQHYARSPHRSGSRRKKQN